MMTPESLVRLHPPREMWGGNPVMAQINWCACGNRSSEFAREFANSILNACEQADQLNKKFLDSEEKG